MVKKKVKEPNAGVSEEEIDELVNEYDKITKALKSLTKKYEKFGGLLATALDIRPDCDAFLDEDDDLFYCNIEGCEDDDGMDAVDILGHLEEEHGMDPYKTDVLGWTDEHDEQYYASLEEDEDDDDEEPWTEKDIRAMSPTDLRDALKDIKVKFPKKAKKSVLVKLLMKELLPDEDEEEEAPEKTKRKKKGK